MAIKRNVIPLFGKNIQPSLMKKIVTSKVQKIYIALDNDALKKALEFCELLLNEGKEVYLVELQGKDPSEMGFESFTLANGFDRYFSKDDYPGDDYDGTWGIFDGPFFQYSALEIDKMKAPFMAGIFTLSSHQPYAVPKEYAGKFPKGTLEIHESIGYTDFSLREFFKTIEIKPWYKNTIFIITADHTSKLETQKFQNIIGHYRVPLLIFNPLGPQGSVIEKVSQHSDIPRMVLEMLGLKGELPLTSKNILKNAEGNALNLINGSDFILMNKDYFLLQKNDQQTLKYSYNWVTGESQLIGESSDQLLKANLQYFFNSLINNKFPSYR
jgi:phosphoglycerol transferase MdoB-like AlkP superfamily enzyme